MAGRKDLGMEHFVENSTEGVPPARTSKGLTANKTMEVYGFVLWISSAVVFGNTNESCHSSLSVLVLYLLWAFIPERTLWQLGITYYPDKYWALAGPGYLCMLVLYFFFMYVAVNLMITPPLSSTANIQGNILYTYIESTIYCLQINTVYCKQSH